MKTIKGHTFDESKWINKRPLVLDLGGNIGEFATEFLTEFPNSIVISYEPTPSLLQSRIGNWIVVERAIGLRNELIEFRCDDLAPFKNTAFFKKGKPCHVLCNDIRDILPLSFDLVKMDIEGSEFEILEALTKQEMEQCQQWSIEFHDFMDPKLNGRVGSILDKLVFVNSFTITKYNDNMDILVET